jgi:hypothetical protein
MPHQYPQWTFLTPSGTTSSFSRWTLHWAGVLQPHRADKLESSRPIHWQLRGCKVRLQPSSEHPLSFVAVHVRPSLHASCVTS